jgi:hypothetical protein
MSDLQRHEPRLSKFQGFTMRRLARGQVKNAAYNPRDIDKTTAAALRAELKANLLVEPLIWNERTRNLVSGHQRLTQIDALEGSPDYSLDFAVISVDEKKERAINVALNNPALQGTFNLGKLEEMLRSDDFDFVGAGINEMQLAEWFGDAIPTSMDPFAIDRAPQPVQDIVGELGQVNEQPRPSRKKKPAETPEERVERMRREKKDYRAAAAERDDTEYFAVLVFPSRAHRERFVMALGLGQNERNVNGMVIAAELGLYEQVAEGKDGEEG